MFTFTHLLLRLKKVIFVFVVSQDAYSLNVMHTPKSVSDKILRTTLIVEKYRHLIFANHPNRANQIEDFAKKTSGTCFLIK